MTPPTHRAALSELAGWSLTAQRAQPERRLAWVNSICLLFLLVGVAGARSHSPPPAIPPPLDDAVPVVLETLPPSPATETPDAAPQNPNETPAAAPVIVVPDSPAIRFAIPAIGALVGPAAMATAPPPLASTIERAVPGPTLLQNTGSGGERPKPAAYPPLAEKLGQQGNVALLMTGDADGNLVTVTVKHSSGSAILDRAARDFVLSHWKLPKGQSGHSFEASINYVLLR